MATDSEERTAVRTYVPAYQKETWTEHAEGLDMSLSEFVRTMVQSGRRGFEGPPGDGAGKDTAEGAPDGPSEEPGSPAVDPGGDALETVILDALENGPCSFDELVDQALTDVREEVREEVGEVLQSLQDENAVTHDPVANEYEVVDGA